MIEDWCINYLAKSLASGAGISYVRYSNNVIERLVLSLKTQSRFGIWAIRPKVDSIEAFSPAVTSIRPMLVFDL